MSVDIQVSFAQESILLNAIRLTVLGGVKALHIEGSDFSSVDEVVINDMPSPDVIILSKTELVAQLPGTLQVAPDVRSVIVLSRQFSVSPRSLIRFRIGTVPGKVRGILRLIQLFLKVLFQTPGSDIFNTEAGGGALKGIGETFGQDEGQNILTDFVIAVTRTNRQLIAMQSRDQRSPRDERLMSATVVGANFDKTQGALFISIQLLSQAGKAAITNVEL